MQERKKGSGSPPLPGVLLDGQARGVLLDSALANAFHVCQICSHCKWAIGFAIGNDGFSLALANAVQAGKGGHLGRVDIDSGFLGLSKTSNQAEHQDEGCEKRSALHEFKLLRLICVFGCVPGRKAAEAKCKRRAEMSVGMGSARTGPHSL